MKNRRSLDSFFKNETRRWSLLGFGLTVIFAIPCLYYSQKIASERQLLTVARAGATAFRPLILEGNIRDAQIQIREALALQPGESAVVRDANLSLIYAVDPSSPKTPKCFVPNAFCWGTQYSSVTTLHPLYFDEPEHKSLFGYLEVTLKPAIDYSILACLFILILAAFVGQSFGMARSLAGATKTLSTFFNQWSEHLKRSPTSSLPETTETPFSEMKGLEAAVDGLHLEIERLQIESAKEAKAAAHFSLLREIGHDLRTPHSQLAKNFALLVDTVKTTNNLDHREVATVERNLKRMGDLIRQVRTLSVGKKSGDNPESDQISLKSEIEILIEDFKNDPEVTENNIIIDFQSSGSVPCAQIPKLEFYRVVENLVRNAITATAVQPSPKVTIRLSCIYDRPILSVIDNGVGIPTDIQHRIFDFNFTTRPARGTGLGLGIVRHICDQYNAALNFKSEAGRGTEFHISFSSAPSGMLATFEDGQEAIYGQA